jgi:hypothetical protein
MGFFGLLAGYIVGLLYSYGKLGFTEPSQNCSNKVYGWIFKHFSQNPAYISQEAALQSEAPGFTVSQPSFPAPGQASGDNAPSTNNVQPVTPFSGTGVRIGSEMSGYEGSGNANYNSQQNVREVPKVPNPSTQKSKLVKDHNAKNPTVEEVKDEDDLEGKQDENSQDSKEDKDILLDLSS